VARVELSEIGVQLEQALRYAQAYGANVLLNVLRGTNAEVNASLTAAKLTSGSMKSCHAFWSSRPAPSALS
jgi:hypothetical protein